MPASSRQILGCLLGLAAGDALGAPYEGGLLERGLWRLIGTTRKGELRWTDDTQMSLDVIESFLRSGELDQDDLAKTFAENYRWSRGYGPGAAKILKRIARGMDWRTANRSVYRDGSFGNGAAMRAPVISLMFSHRPSELEEAVVGSAIITHVHPLALEGALLISHATAAAIDGKTPPAILDAARSVCRHEPFLTRLARAEEWLQAAGDVSTAYVRRHLGHGISAHQSCVTAPYVALRFLEQPFLAMQQFIARLGGDADTVGAMAGAIWGAANTVDRLPEAVLEKLEQRDRITQMAMALHQRLGE